MHLKVDLTAFTTLPRTPSSGRAVLLVHTWGIWLLTILGLISTQASVIHSKNLYERDFECA